MKIPQVTITLVALSLLIADCAPAADSGNVINLNGQAWSGRWLRRVEQGRSQLYVQEDWLTGGLGVQMLDSETSDRQRVRWFSSPLFTPTAFDNQGKYRYLAITPFAEQWRTEIVGSTLNLYTPDTIMEGLRRSRQPWGDRLVIDLNRRTPWRVSQQADMINLTVSAEVAANLPIDAINVDASTGAIAGNLIKSIKVLPQGKLTQIQIQTTTAINPAIELLSSPSPKIVIDLRRDYLPPSLTVQWANGLRRIERIVEVPNPSTKESAPKTLKFAVTALEVDLKQPQLKLRPIWSNPDNSPNGMLGVSPLSQMAGQAGAVGAINGGFFNRIRRLPVGAIRQGGRWLAGTALVRGAIAWNETGDVLIDRLNFSEEITTGNQIQIKLTNLNSGYVQRGIARYTPTWGSNYSPLTENELLIVVKGDRVVAQYQGAAVGVGQLPIPEDGYLLVARQTPEAAKQLPLGMTVRGRQAFVPNQFAPFPNLIGAGPLLLKNGNLVLDAKAETFQAGFDTQAADRSVIATMPQKGKLLLATIQAAPSGQAPNLFQTAAVLKKLGAVDALNLDGGSSTTLYLGGQILNRSITQTASVHNAIAIFITPPSQF
ncbi:phosphodiester glycosidase family protein [Pseudanabaena sp. FACHB-1277]|uniref:Phosphodiester glycosidase family protein n=1 Tax=Pseudanabaena cinerea FACHB-1277 TaxID=2949581 RepID=A0A926UXC1_9CYAN|nr:phosphodiester glycosidase family protein [Pseudanabaena cinerea]MBD2152596.1 phosphodiester glycosidase family protein [Pseudanabaena cinerea FACHB-1277]